MNQITGSKANAVMAYVKWAQAARLDRLRSVEDIVEEEVRKSKQYPRVASRTLSAYAKTCMDRGESAAAAQAFTRAYRSDPSDMDALRLYALFLATSSDEEYRDPQRALDLVGHLRTDERYSSNDIYVIAAVYGATKQYDVAVTLLDTGLRIVKDSSNDYEIFTEMKKRYLAGKPWYQPEPSDSTKK